LRPKTEHTLGNTTAHPAPLVALPGQEGAPASQFPSITRLQPVTSSPLFTSDLLTGNFTGGDEARSALALIAPWVDQLGVMQQQMFDQFHQVILTMFRMFGTLHQDQAELVRGELDRIREVSRELQALQARPDGTKPDTRGESIGGMTEPELHAEPAHDRTDPLKKSNSGTSAIDLDLASLGLTDLTSSRGEELSKKSSSDSDVAASPTEGQTDRTADSASPDTHIHAFISQRILALQAERLSRWQKILNLISGSQL
jgi:hypothetical protein